MHSTTHDNKAFLPGILFRRLGFLISQARALFALLSYLATVWFMLPAKWLLQRQRPEDPPPAPTGENP